MCHQLPVLVGPGGVVEPAGGGDDEKHPSLRPPSPPAPADAEDGPPDAARAKAAAARAAAEVEGTGTLYIEADKSERLDICACSKVHTRAFHLAWSSFHIAFFAWFSVPPLLPMIRDSLGLTKRQVHHSHLASVSTTVVARVLVGPLVDYYGPKTSMSLLLVAGAIPFFFAPLVTGWRGLIALRAGMGVLGAAFVMATAWATSMYRRTIVGRANALVAGWGNVGGGTSQVLMVELYQALAASRDPSVEANTWRLVLLVPASTLLGAAVAVYTLGTDTPRGDIADLKRRGEQPPSPKASLADAARDYMTWVLALQYAVSFGVELVTLNMAASYFNERLHMPALTAGRLATYGGATNVLARPLGGWASDKANARWGAKGRLWLQFILIVLDGAFLLRFAAARTKGAAAVYLLVFSAFVQAANGSCFSLVPYLSRQSGGAVAGIVSSGGTMGSILLTLMFSEGDFQDASRGFAIMGWIALACAPTVWLINPGVLEEGHKQKQEEPRVAEAEAEAEADVELAAAVVPR